MRWLRDGSLFNSLKAASLTEEVEDSLRRLAVEAIDLYQVHWPEPDGDIEEGWETLARLREQGKIRWIGVSNFSVAQMKRAQRIAPVTSLQPPYSLLRRDIEVNILSFAVANDIGVINYSPMASGLLTGEMTAESIAALRADDWRRKHAQFAWPLLSRNLRLVEILREIGAAHNVSAGVVAVAWTLHRPAITGAIVGLRSVREVEEIAAALEFELSQDEYDRIGAFLSSLAWHWPRLLRLISPKSWVANLSEGDQKPVPGQPGTLRNAQSSE